MRVIILAAGMGTRLRPLTDDKPKSLVEVNGEPMIERQLRFLKEKGIEDIIIVTGYMAEKFEYLKEKYGVKLIHNDKYDVYNNVYTMYLVREYLEDAYVSEADVYMVKNYFDPEIKKSAYFGGYRENFVNEWVLGIGENNKLHSIELQSGSDYILAGLSYWTKDSSKLIKEKLEEVIDAGHFDTMYWDEVVNLCLEDIDAEARIIGTNDWFEIDSVSDLENAEACLTTLSF